MDKSKNPNPERLTLTYPNGNYLQKSGIGNNICINVSNCNVGGDIIVSTGNGALFLSLIKAQSEMIDRLLSIIEKQTTMISGGQGNG